MYIEQLFCGKKASNIHGSRLGFYRRFIALFLLVYTSASGAPVTWTDPVNVLVTGQVVEKIAGGSNWNAGAYSLETIGSGNFYIEFIATETQKHRFIGFTDSPAGTVFNNMDGALLLHSNGNVHVYRNGSFRTDLGPFLADATRMRIQVRGTDIEYYLNDSLVFTDTTATISYPVYADLAFNANNGTFSDVDFGAGEPPPKPRVASFVASDPDGQDDTISAGDVLTLTFSEATDQAGLSGTLSQGAVDDLLTFTHSIGSGYTGSWTSASIFTVTLATPPTSLPRLLARVTPKTSPYQILPAAGGIAADGLSMPLVGDFGGEDVSWTNRTNAEAAGSTLTKTNGTQQFTSGGASSRRFYEDDSWAEMTAVLTTHMRLIGFTAIETPQFSADLQFAVAFSDTGQVLSYADGAFNAPSPAITYSPGDVARVSIEGDDVRFYHNDIAFRTVSLGGVSPYPLRVGGILGYSGENCAIDNARRSIPPPIIESFWADDPDNEDGWLSAGDTMEITFTAATNESPSGPGVIQAAAIDSLFTFSHDIGDDYEGEWLTSSIFRITLLEPPERIPRFQATVVPAVTPGLEIRNAGDKGLPSTTVSPALDGHWGAVIVEWTNLTNAIASGADIVKSNVGQFQSGGVSTERFEGGEPWIEGTADLVGHFRLFGFTTEEWPSEPHHLLWAIGFGEAGDIIIYESGTNFTPDVPSTFVGGDVARLAVEGGDIVYYLENYEIHRTSLSASLPFPMRYAAVLGYSQHSASIRNASHSVATPIILDFRVDDPDDKDDVYSAGDTFAIQFDRATDQVGTRDKAGVDSLFTFSNPSALAPIPVSIGTDYVGEWTSSSLFRITVLEVNGTEQVERFSTIAEPNLSGNPIYLAGKSVGKASIPSAGLMGDFGGQDVIWSTQTGFLRGNPTIDGNTITKTAGPQWSQGSQSLQEFVSGDVWVEAWAPDSTSNAVTFGLGSAPPENQPYSPDYAICLCEDGEVRVFDSDSGTPAYVWDGQYQPGDTARVEVTGGMVNYFINGVELPYSSVIGAADYPLYAEASLGYSDGASVINTRLSYPIPTLSRVEVDDPDDMDSSISAGDTISLYFTLPTNQPGNPDSNGSLPKSEVDSLFNFSHTVGADYVGAWTQASMFVVSITDATGTSLSRFETVVTPIGANLRNASAESRPTSSVSPPIWGDFGGRRVVWMGLTNAASGGIHGNDIYRHGGPVAWDSGGSSEGEFELLAGPVYIEAVIQETDADKAIGLGKNNVDTDIADIEYGMFLDSAGRIFTSISGTLSSNPVGNYFVQDIVRVAFEYDGAQAAVRWYNNDVLLHELPNTTISHLYPVTVDSALYAPGASFLDAKTNWPCPFPSPDSYSTDENSTIQHNVWDNDIQYGSALSYVGTPPSTGSLTLSTRGAFTYSPIGHFEALQEGQNTTVEFTYFLGNTRCANGTTVVISIDGVNDCPVASDDSASTTENGEIHGDASSNDSDIDGDSLTFSAIAPGNGLSSMSTNGSFSYTPNGAYAYLALGETATDSFTYLVSDGRCDVIGKVAITIDGSNDCPAVTNDSFYIEQDTGGTGNVLSNDSDPEGSPLSANLSSAPVGAITFQADGAFSYNSNGNFGDLASGETVTDNFTYIVTDGTCTSLGTVVLIVSGGNDCPVGAADSLSTDQNTLVTGNVLSNDTDPDDDSLSATDATGTSGIVTLAADGSYSYDPNGQFNHLAIGESAQDSFTYTLSDGNCDVTVAGAITIHGTNDCPVASADTTATDEDIAVVGNVLTNDSDVDGETVTASNATGAAGTVTLDADGSYTYDTAGEFAVLESGEIATDSFSYTISDGNCTDQATVVVVITGVNTCPDAIADFVSTDADSIVAGNVISNDIDADSPFLDASDPTGAIGTVVLSPDGSFVYDPAGNFDQLGSGETATDSFTYTVGDGECTVQGVAVITIEGVNDCPVANDDVNATDEDSTISGDVKANDTDIDGGTLTASNPVGAAGIVTLNTDGSYVYDPDNQFTDLDAGEFAVDSFSYSISDGECEDNAIVSITINGINDCPVAVDDTNTTNQNSAVAGNVLGNDTDSESHPLTASNASGTIGSVTLNADGSYTYDPNGQFEQLDTGETATDAFTYSISDGNCSDQATVVITITGTNDCPIANTDTNATTEDASTFGTTLTNDSDADGETLTASNATGAAGSVTLNADGSYTYDPNGQFEQLDDGETATDAFTYSISDGNCEDTATVVITINGANDCPIANADTNATTEDASTSGNTLTNDSDVDGETLTASNATGAAGTVTLNADGSYTYDPNGQFDQLDTGETATDAFSYSISDGNCSDTGTVVITINGINDCPIANPDTDATSEDASTSGNILTNDSDGDGETLTASNATGAAGSVTLNADGSYTYDPNGQFEQLDDGEVATDAFTYSISDGNCSDQATVVITINGANDCPIANADTNATTEDASTSGNILTNDSDVDGETLTASNATGAAGTVTLNADGSYTYDPNGQFDQLDTGETATDAFTYSISDGNCSDQATVVITINGINDCPIANPDTDATSEDASTSGNILTNDSDGDGETLTASNATGAAGTVTLNADGSYTYDPNGQFEQLDDGEVATDAFTYSISDGNCSDQATVVITINGANDCPIANADTNATTEDASTSGNTLTNDSDVDGETLTASNATGAAGSVTLNADGSYTYDPNGQFEQLDTGETATDAFTYSISDGNCSDQATVVITINGANDCPIANADTNATTEDVSTSGNTLTNDSDGDGETLNASNATGAAGSVTLNTDGSYTYDPNGQFEQLDDGETATDAFTYSISDGNCEDTATVVITINGANDCPIANADTNATTEDASTSGNTLTNDSDVDGETLTASNATGAAGSVTLNADGSYTYDPNGQFEQLDTGETATDAFTYSISDGNCSDQATVVITINGANDCPIANADTNASTEDVSTSGNTLTNDSDGDGETLTASNATGAAGSVTLNADGSYTYDPNGQFEQLDDGETATDAFTYSISDGNCEDTATVVITINGANDCPIANADTNATTEDASTSGNTLTNDSDVDGETLTASNATGAAGSVTLNADGSYTYDPNGQFEQLDTGETATDAFTYSISDGNCSDQATVVITINGANDCPIANADTNATTEDVSTSGNTLTNDSDVDGETLTASNATGAAGSVTLNADGSYTYDPNGQFEQLDDGETATDAFTYSISDGNCEDTATVVITINGANDCPIANADTNATTEDASTSGNTLTNDSDVDGETLTASNATGAAGSVTLNADGSYTYDPNGQFEQLDTGETATDAFTYSISDGNCSDQATVVITINGANDCPIANADSGATDEDNATTGHVISSDTDIDGETVSASNAQGATGTVILATDGSFTYAPNNQFETLDTGETTTDVFTYIISDGTCSDVGTVVLRISGVNDCPIAVADTATTTEDTTTTGNVGSNDTDIDGETLTASNAQGATGTVNLDSNGSFTYAPNGQFESLSATETSTDFFTYTISDGTCTSHGTVVITINGVNDCPVANTRMDVTDEDSALLGDITTSTADVDGDSLTVSIQAGPAGTVNLHSSGNFTYNPAGYFDYLDSGETATDSFRYLVSDGSCDDEATSLYTIHGVNDCPVAADDSHTTVEDELVLGNLLANDTDVDDEPLIALNPTGATGVVTLATNGSFTYNPAGQFDHLGSSQTSVDSFMYTVSDGTCTEMATVSILIYGLDNRCPTTSCTITKISGCYTTELTSVQPVAGGYKIDLSVTTDGSTGVGCGELLYFAIEAEEQSYSTVCKAGVNGGVDLGWDLGTNAFNGFKIDNTTAFGDGNAGTFTISYTLTHLQDQAMLAQTGLESHNFSFTADEFNWVTLCMGGAVTSTDEDTAITGQLGFAAIDEDGDTIVASSPNGAAGIVLLASNGSFSYDPGDAFQYLDNCETASDTFTYILSDGSCTGQGTVVIHISGSNDYPVAIADNASTDESSTVTGNALTNDYDVDDTRLIATHSNGALGEVSLQVDGSYIYDPAGKFDSLRVGESATDSFTYILSNGHFHHNHGIAVGIGHAHDYTDTGQIAGYPEEDHALGHVLHYHDHDDACDENDHTWAEANHVGHEHEDDYFDHNTEVGHGSDTGAVYTSQNPQGDSDHFKTRDHHHYGCFDVGKVVITIYGEAGGAIAEDQHFAVNEDSLLEEQLNFSGFSGPLSFYVTSGDAVIEDDGSFSYDQAGAFDRLCTGESATDQFSYIVRDTGGAEASANVSIVIHGSSDPEHNVPFADAGGPYSLAAPGSIMLDGSRSTAGCVPITTYDWDLDNDGEFDDASGATLTASFNTFGTHVVGLRVRSAQSATDSGIATVTVGLREGTPPVADAGGPYTAQPGETIVLDGSGSSDFDNDILWYQWDLNGDGLFDDADGVSPSLVEYAESSRVVSLRAIDSQGHVHVAGTVLTYKQDDVIQWTNLINVDADSNTLTKTNDSVWSGNAWSVRALSEPGYVATSATRGGKRMLGLSRVDGGASIQTIQHALYLNVSALEIYEFGVHRGTFGAFEEGDEMRITIEGRDIVYTRNDEELRRVIQSVPADSYAYHADVSMETIVSSLTDIRLVTPAPEPPTIQRYSAFDPDNLNTHYSDDDTLTIVFHQPTDRAGLSGVQEKEQVDLLFDFSPAPGADYQGAWADAATYVVSITSTDDLGPGIGTARVTVNGGIQILNAKAPLPAAFIPSPVLGGHWGSTTVLWTNPANVLLEGAKVTRLFASNEAWDSGAYSSRLVGGNCYMETTVTQRGKNKLIGFRHSDSPADSHTQFDLAHAFFMHHSGSLEVYQSGVQKGSLGRYAIGDVLRMAINGPTLSYYKNGVLLRTDDIGTSYSFHVGCSLQNPLGTIDNTILVVDPAPLAIASFGVSDPDDRDRAFGIGDVFTITFEGPTTMPRASITDLFAFSTPPGSKFWGLWTAPGRYEIEVLATGSEPVVGIDSVAPAGIVKIHYANSQFEVLQTPAILSGSYGEAEETRPPWDDLSWRATISNGSITASFQAGKLYEIPGLLCAPLAQLNGPSGTPLISQSTTATSVSTTYQWPDGTTESINWDFDNGDLRCTSSAPIELPALDHSGLELVTVDSAGRGLVTGVRVDQQPIALMEGADSGWVFSAPDGKFSVGGSLISDGSELRIRRYTGDWRPAVEPHRATLGLLPFTSPVRAHSTVVDAQLIPQRTLLGPLRDLAEITSAAGAGYVVVADLSHVSETDAINAGAAVLYAADAADLPVDPGALTMSNSLTAGTHFALFDNPGHALGGYIYSPYVIIAPAGDMHTPTDVTSLRTFMSYGAYLPAYGVDSWNVIVATVQSGDIDQPVWEQTTDSFSLKVGEDRIGTRVTGLSDYSGSGAIANWLVYNAGTHLGLSPDATYYFDPTLSLDPDAFHLSAVPADFTLLSHDGFGYERLEVSGNGNINMVIPNGYSVFLDGNRVFSGPQDHPISGNSIIHAVPDTARLIHGTVTNDSLMGFLPFAQSISLEGHVSSAATIHVNGQLLFSGTGSFNVDLTAFAGSHVLIEFVSNGSWTGRQFTFVNAPPVADIGAPYTGPEGNTIQLSAGNSFNADSFLWDLDNDGVYDDASGADVGFNAVADGSYPISLRIERGAAFDIATTVITVNNLPPTANIGGPYHAAPGETITLDASASSDPGNDPLSFAWDFNGDGVYDDGNGATPNFTPIAMGNTPIGLRVDDDFGASTFAITFLLASNDVVFTAVQNLVVGGNNLERVSGSNWTASAISVGSLLEDGYLAFTATIAGKAMVGLSQNDTASHFRGIEYAFYKNLNRLEIYESGIQRGSYGTFAEGDNLRITVDKGDVIYTHNGVELRRIIAALPLEGFSYNADVAIEARGTTVENVELAIPTPESPYITDYEGFDPDNLDTAYGVGDTVSISFHQKTDMGGFAQDEMLTKAQVNQLFEFNPSPGANYRGYWSHPAVFVVEILATTTSAPAFGFATVRVAGDITIYNSKVPLPADLASIGTLAGHWGSVVVLWTNPVNVIVDGNKLTKPGSAGNSWNAGGTSSRSFTGDAYMETIVTETGKNRMIGFAEADTDQHFASLNYAIFMHSSNTAEIYENGGQRGRLGGFQSGDTLRIERRDDEIHYMLNGLTRRVTSVDAELPLKVDCSLSSTGSTLNNTILVLPDSIITGARIFASERIRDAITLQLQPGWNLIGIPLRPDDPAPSILGKFVNGLDAPTKTLEVGRGYWVFSSEPASRLVLGFHVPQPPIPSGWSLYTPVTAGPTPHGTTAWGYEGGKWIRAHGHLAPGKGYLLHRE